MSRSSTSTTHTIRVTSPSAYPGSDGTVAIRVKPNWNHNDSTDHKIFWHVVSDIADPTRLQFQKFSDNNCYIGWYASGVDHRIAVAATSGMFTSGSWSDHVFTWSDSANTEEYFVNGSSAATRATTLTTHTVSQSITLGNANASAAANNSNASFADYALWDVILTAGEVAAYHAGVDPRLIRPGSLLRYAPLDGNNSTEPDLLCADGFVVTSAAKDVNPRRLGPKRRQVALVSAGGGTDGNASTAPAGSTLTAPTATASASAQASGALAGASLTAPTATATGTTAGNATATGAPAGLILTAPTATATGSATASGALAGATLTAPTGTATGSAQAFAAFMAAILTAPTATASSDLPTIGRPASDASNSGWTASTGSDLYAMLDEVTPDSADYIVTTATGSICEMPLQTTAYPGTASQVLSYRASSSTGNSVIVRLKNTGGATVRTETQVLTSTDTLYQITLTAPEIAAITSGALSVELESA